MRVAALTCGSPPSGSRSVFDQAAVLSALSRSRRAGPKLMPPRGPLGLPTISEPPSSVGTTAQLVPRA